MYDLAIIGGGINGVGIARDAAGRGLRVLLLERDDLAGHTSSASTKLVHGGLRYLEHYEFALVRKALKEREVLLRAAPHIIWPLEFVLPVDKGMRPAWMLRIGLFLYDHLGGREILPSSGSVRLRDDPRGDALRDRLERGFTYSDCWVEDARLVALSARDAAEHGADIRTRTECTALERGDDHWTITVDGDAGRETLSARLLVNAAGPWVDRVNALYDSGRNQPQLRLVKGSHIIVPRQFDGDHAYIFQNGDGRIIFAIPYERDFTLIGTTDQPWSHDEAPARIDDGEVAYLCEAASEYFAKPITPDDVVWTYAGVRPLYDDKAMDASKVTRDYVFDYDDSKAPVLSIFGGKITTYRELSLQAVKTMAPALKCDSEDWTKTAKLPGGDFAYDGFDALVAACDGRWPYVPSPVMQRLVRAYGSDVPTMLAEVSGETDLGQDFGAGLYEIELRWLMTHEFARNADDVLWRRSKLGLHMTEDQRAAVAQWFAAQV